jgi:hypothetical protein
MHKKIECLDNNVLYVNFGVGSVSRYKLSSAGEDAYKIPLFGHHPTFDPNCTDPVGPDQTDWDDWSS